MTKYAISFALLATLALAGCKSAEEKKADIGKEYQAANDQYAKDCPEYIEHSIAIDEGFGATVTPAQRATAAREQQVVDANLKSPHCKELREKRDALMSEFYGGKQ